MAEEENKKEYVPIYYDSPEKAFRDSVTGPEANAFRASFSETEKCVGDIQTALKNNRESSGKFSSTDFMEGLLDRYGKDRVEYCLASYIRSRENETPYFSEDVKAWAHEIRISDSYMIANTIIIAGGDDMVNALAEELRVMDAEAAYIAAKEGDTSALAETDLEEDAAEDADMSAEPENTAESENTAEPENTAESENTAETEKSAEPEKAAGPEKSAEPEKAAEPEYEAEPEEVEVPYDGRAVRNEDGSLTVTMPEDAVVRRYQTSAVLCMPRNRGYDMYRYMVDIKCFRENGDGTVSVTVGTNEAHTLTLRRRNQEIKLSSDKIYKAFSGAGSSDYIPQKFTIEIPTDAVQGNYPNMIRCKFPDSSRYVGQHVVIPSIFKDVVLSDDEKTVFSVPDYINFSVRDDDGNDILIPVSDLAREVNGGTYNKRVRWTRVILPGEAMLHVYERHTMFKMPEGSYSGFIYYLPNGMVPVGADGSITARIPEDKKILIKNGMTGEKEELTVLQWSNLVTGKTAESYVVKRDEKATQEDEFVKRAEKTKSVVPPEMLAEANWIPVRVTSSKLDKPGDKRRPNKFAVSPDKRFSCTEAMYRNIGTGFDAAVRAGRGSGATLMGYCFTKDSGIVCIELDGCLNPDGSPKTDKARDVMENFEGTYVERSISGEGLHVFGKMTDPQIETLSRDSEAEVFSSCGYVALTGDVVKSPRCLAPLDEGHAGKFIRENFDERREISRPTEEDKKILDKAFGGVNGQEAEVLYSGGNVSGGREFNDMSLALRLANASAGDTEAVIRLYNASGREDKAPELIAHIAKRATDSVKDHLRSYQKMADEDESVHAARTPQKREWSESRPGKGD